MLGGGVAVGPILVGAAGRVHLSPTPSPCGTAEHERHGGSSGADSSGESGLAAPITTRLEWSG